MKNLVELQADSINRIKNSIIDLNQTKIKSINKLFETFMTYIQCHPKERNKNIINTINNILFII